MTHLYRSRAQSVCFPRCEARQAAARIRAQPNQRPIELIVTTPCPTDASFRVFLDSADLNQWDRMAAAGIFYGITTNPSILERDGVPCGLESLQRFTNAAFRKGAEEVHLQAWGDTVDKLHSCALDLAGINPKKVVVKLPCTAEGVRTAAILRSSNIRVTLTGLYAAHQVVLASSVGAEYAAPYMGRMDDAFGADTGYHEICRMQQIVSIHKSDLRLLVASVRKPTDIARLAAVGCNTFTVGPNMADKMFNVAQTIDAAQEFEAASHRNRQAEPSVPPSAAIAYKV